MASGHQRLALLTAVSSPANGGASKYLGDTDTDLYVCSKLQYFGRYVFFFYLFFSSDTQVGNRPSLFFTDSIHTA